ncbi:unnamed protein product, partial [Heterotrigona itama]
MGFIRQRKDGTTSLQIIVTRVGVVSEANQRPVSLVQLIGKLNHGTGALAGFRKDRRIIIIILRAFESYTPRYDSTFTNLSKEETDLVYQIYGYEIAVGYTESILDFAKYSDYMLTMVDDLLFGVKVDIGQLKTLSGLEIDVHVSENADNYIHKNSRMCL